MFVRVAEWLEDYAGDACSAIALILAGYVQVALSTAAVPGGFYAFSFTGLGYAFYVSVVLVIASVIFNATRTQALRPARKRLSELEGITEQVAASYRKLCDLQLSDILKGELGYGDTERISVYRHRGENVFQILGRYSENPRYADIRRYVYPDNQGVIGIAWEHRTASVDNLPDFDTEPGRYHEVLEQDWNVPRDTAKKLTMKSRSYVAHALYEPTGTYRVAIIVVESTRVSILDEGKVVDAIDNPRGEPINTFLEKMKSLEPNVERNRTAGF